VTKALLLQPLTLVSSTLPSHHTHTTLIITTNNKLYLNNNQEGNSNPRPPHPTLKDNLTLLQGNPNSLKDALTINTLSIPRMYPQHHASVSTMRTMPTSYHLSNNNIIILAHAPHH
jgi:hypothetical protein